METFGSDFSQHAAIRMSLSGVGVGLVYFALTGLFTLVNFIACYALLQFIRGTRPTWRSLAETTRRRWLTLVVFAVFVTPVGPLLKTMRIGLLMDGNGGLVDRNSR